MQKSVLAALFFSIRFTDRSMYENDFVSVCVYEFVSVFVIVSVFVFVCWALCSLVEDPAGPCMGMTLGKKDAQDSGLL